MEPHIYTSPFRKITEDILVCRSKPCIWKLLWWLFLMFFSLLFSTSRRSSFSVVFLFIFQLAHNFLACVHSSSSSTHLKSSTSLPAWHYQNWMQYSTQWPMSCKCVVKQMDCFSIFTGNNPLLVFFSIVFWVFFFYSLTVWSPAQLCDIL